MDDYRAANRERWNELVPLHLASPGYGVEAFKQGGLGLHPIEVAEIGEVRDLDLLHLQCHFGLDSLALARLGAHVTGIDFAPDAIRAARALAAETGLAARFVECDLYAAPDHVDGHFDLVFTTWGTICWLPELIGWARVIAHFLKPGGRFYFADVHPFALVFDDSPEAGALPAGSFRLGYPYFAHDEPQVFENTASYVETAAPTVATRTYEWAHPVSEIVNALVGAGLSIEFMHEHPAITWRLLPGLEEGPDRLWRWPPGTRHPLPLALSIAARKPG
jgi:SAM-dependent methyltransferase